MTTTKPSGFQVKRCRVRIEDGIEQRGSTGRVTLNNTRYYTGQVWLEHGWVHIDTVTDANEEAGLLLSFQASTVRMIEWA